MKSKWYISTFLIILAFLGLKQEQDQVANQQIVLQFIAGEVTSENSPETALATITRKLESLGIDKIKIIEKGDAQLSIQYYSDIDALSVGKFLSEDGELELFYHGEDESPYEFPNEELPETFSLVVLDLQQQNEAGLSLNGKFSIELKQDFQRIANPVVLQIHKPTALRQDIGVALAFQICSVVALEIDNISQIIPEVRAGPDALGNS